MKLTVQLKAAFALVIVSTLVMMVSCARPLSLPVTASASTPLITATAATNTATATFTPTPTNTGCSIGGYTCTFTATSTSTNTYTATATPTITNTPLNTNTPTITMTGTNTGTPTNTSVFTNTFTPTATNTQVCATAWNDFDEGAWSGTVPVAVPTNSYLVNGYTGGSSPLSFDVNSDPSSGAGGISIPNGLEMQGTATSAGVVLETLTEHGSDYGSNLNVSSDTGSTMKLSVMIYASQPTTVANVFIWDSAGNHSKYASFNGTIAAGGWQNIVVPIGNNLTISSASGPWSMTSGSGIDFTQLHAVGFDFTTPAGAYDIFIDNIYFTCQ